MKHLLKSQKILVANRSEIACRVFQAAREMGIRTVGIFVPGDEQGRQVTLADEVVCVKSYLDSAEIVAAAQKVGATLIHPGYGFLSERAVFARAVEAAGILFIGPRPDTMEAMGDKISSKKMADTHQIPTAPWAIASGTRELKAAAQRIGFPLLIKASAGGGGKGMRKVMEASALDEAAESAAEEAFAAFGDRTLFVERCFESPRHIEVQVFGDGSGEGVHLFERECSLQRRHQKVWEEAPAAMITPQTRQGLLAAALSLVRATRYRNAGTLEFLVEGTGKNEKFYFLEMNTRLQVEHPVSEAVTGCDLVRAQIEQALDPKKMALAQSEAPRGHAIEVRLYAEDPAAGFMPAPGEVLDLYWPTGAGIRVDSGIERGQKITPQFDPMLAKIIVHAGNRQAALARMRYALEETVVLGPGTNQAFLRALCGDPRVVSGEFHTRFLEQGFDWTVLHPTADQLRGLGDALDRMSAVTSPDVGDAGGVSPWTALSGKTERGV